MPKKRIKKIRGSKTCGGGAKKKRRGAGHRGGRGNAGVTKHKYLRTIKLVKAGLYQIGKHGFTRPKAVSNEYKNERYLKNKLKELKEEGVLDDYLYNFFISRTEINVGDIDLIAEKLVERGLAKKEGETYFIDLTNLGYNKLLGAGKVTKNLNIKVEYATSKAVEKIEAMGGSVSGGV